MSRASPILIPRVMLIVSSAASRIEMGAKRSVASLRRKLSGYADMPIVFGPSLELQVQAACSPLIYRELVAEMTCLVVSARELSNGRKY